MKYYPLRKDEALSEAQKLSIGTVRRILHDNQALLVDVPNVDAIPDNVVLALHDCMRAPIGTRSVQAIENLKDAPADERKLFAKCFFAVGGSGGPVSQLASYKAAAKVMKDFIADPDLLESQIFRETVKSVFENESVPYETFKACLDNFQKDLQQRRAAAREVPRDWYTDDTVAKYIDDKVGSVKTHDDAIAAITAIGWFNDSFRHRNFISHVDKAVGPLLSKISQLPRSDSSSSLALSSKLERMLMYEDAAASLPADFHELVSHFIKNPLNPKSSLTSDVNMVPLLIGLCSHNEQLKGHVDSLTNEWLRSGQSNTVGAFSFMWSHQIMSSMAYGTVDAMLDKAVGIGEDFPHRILALYPQRILDRMATSTRYSPATMMRLVGLIKQKTQGSKVALPFELTQKLAQKLPLSSMVHDIEMSKEQIRTLVFDKVESKKKMLSDPRTASFDATSHDLIACLTLPECRDLLPELLNTVCRGEAVSAYFSIKSTVESLQDYSDSRGNREDDEYSQNIKKRTEDDKQFLALVKPQVFPAAIDMIRSGATNEGDERVALQALDVLTDDPSVATSPELQSAVQAGRFRSEYVNAIDNSLRQRFNAIRTGNSNGDPEAFNVRLRAILPHIGQGLFEKEARGLESTVAHALYSNSDYKSPLSDQEADSMATKMLERDPHIGGSLARWPEEYVEKLMGTEEGAHRLLHDLNNLPKALASASQDTLEKILGMTKQGGDMLSVMNHIHPSRWAKIYQNALAQPESPLGAQLKHNYKFRQDAIAHLPLSLDELRAMSPALPADAKVDPYGREFWEEGADDPEIRKNIRTHQFFQEQIRERDVDSWIRNNTPDLAGMYDNDDIGVVHDMDPSLSHLKELGLEPAPSVVSTSFGTNKLRKLRDIIRSSSPNGTMHYKNANKLLAGNWDKYKDSKGFISADSLQSAIDAAPSIKYNVNHAFYGGDGFDNPKYTNSDGEPDWSRYLGAQRHNDEHQNVFRINITNDMVNSMVKEGVWKLYKEIHKDYHYSGHPIGSLTGLGWIRWTGHPKHGIFVDEIQSDFHSGLRDFEKIATKKDKQRVAKIREIVFGNKHPSVAIGESFFQWLRDNGHAGCKIAMHGLESKARISLPEYTEQDGKLTGKPPPVHFRETYEEAPKKEWGMEPATYNKDNMPTQNNPNFQDNRQIWQDTLKKYERGEALTEIEEQMIKAILGT